MSGVVLSKDQRNVLEFIKSNFYEKQRKIVLICGPAGTGKSTLVNEIVVLLYRLYEIRDPDDSDLVIVTGTTGISVHNLEVPGRTLHSAFGIGKEKTYKHMLRNLMGDTPWAEANRARIRNMSTVIVDEMSMLDGYLLDDLDRVMRKIRGDDRVFGGVQMIFVGDFFQLPPIENRKEKRYMFMSDVITKTLASGMAKVFKLTQIYRQGKDTLLQRILTNVRNGIQDEEDMKVLEKRVGLKPSPSSRIVPTVIYSTNDSVHSENMKELKKIDSDVIVFRAGHCLTKENKKYRGPPPSVETISDCFSKCTAIEKLELKVGAQVMLLKNMMELGLVNGSRGVIVGFHWDSNTKRYRGVYVKFLSKSTRSSGELQKETLVHHRKIDKVLERRKSKMKKLYGDDVEFIGPAEFDMESLWGRITRTQIPLALAWSLTVHKTQGLTLDCVVFHPEKIFEPRLLYVAFSRVRSLDSLFLSNMNYIKNGNIKKIDADVTLFDADPVAYALKRLNRSRQVEPPLPVKTPTANVKRMREIQDDGKDKNENDNEKEKEKKGTKKLKKNV